MTTVHTVKSKGKISQNFVAFSEYINFNNFSFFIPAEPKNLSISTTDGRDISSSSIIGPFHEGYELRLTCESGGGKPIPRVTWYNGSNVISGKLSRESIKIC